MAEANQPAQIGDSSIAELQSVFSTLLSLTRDKVQHPHPTAIPRWTGSFRLFDFPRELRDRIYHYVLYIPNGIVYRRSRTQRWPFTDPVHTTLFLASRAVYAEALEIFLLSNTIRLTYRNHLSGTLRLFPDKPARLLQKIKLEYRPHVYERNGRGILGGSWADSITQAREARHFFPRLRECTALWYVRGYNAEIKHEMAGIELDGKTVEEMTAMWGRWLRHRHSEDGLVPPRWLRVEFVPLWAGEDRLWQPAFDAALDGFRREVEKKETAEEELEASGRKWLEEAWDDGSRGKSAKKRRRRERMGA